MRHPVAILPVAALLIPLAPISVLRAQSAHPPRASGMTLQPGDEILIRSLIVKELSEKTFKLDERGDINAPLLSRVHLAGLSVPDAEKALVTKASKYYVNPDLEVSLSSAHADQFSVIGSVGAPGVYQIKTRLRLLDALSQAGGVRPDAGPYAVVTRVASSGPIPVPSSQPDASGGSVATVDLKSLLNAADAGNNFVIQPNDSISIPAAQVVYVIGNVKHAGGFTLNGRPNLSVLQALALAEGLDVRAAPSKARILRRETQPEQQIPVDLKKLLKGKEEDVVLHPNDILFVPSSTEKVVATRSIEAMIQIGTGLLIWR